MNQEKMIELGKIINSDYNNIAGIIVLKNGKTLYENTLMNILLPTPSM